MEHEKIEGMAKKIWKIVRVAFFMLRKGIVSKRKILLDLNIMMKRGKLAGKSIRNLTFFHHRDDRHFSAVDLHYAASIAANPGEYEFSCSNTPLYRHYFGGATDGKKSHRDDRGISDVETVNRVLEMVTTSSNHHGPEFGRVMGSPFPLEDDPVEDCRVDEAAEDFINQFYSQLKQQKCY